jgi:hypothetical protein
VPGAGGAGRGCPGGNGGSTGLTAVDPWLKTHLRLAERQGLLTGRHISPVQAFGLVILNHLDEIAEAKDDIEAFKLSLVANGQFDHKGLFPEFFPPETVEIDDKEASNPEAQYDYSEVSWKSGSEAKDEFERVMAALQKSASGAVRGDQLSTRATWGEWR